MNANPSATRRIFVPVVEEAPRISDAERAELILSLEQGRAEIAAGRYDILTSAALEAEFDGILEHDLSDDELDAAEAVPRCDDPPQP